MLHRLVEHRSAPDDGVVLAQEESHRNDLDAVLLGRHRAFDSRLGERVHVQQSGDRRPVHVRVHDSHARAGAGEREGQIRRDGGLPDAAFAARHRDHVLHRRDEPLLDRTGRSADARGHRNVHPADSRECRHGLSCQLPHAFALRTSRCRQRDGEPDRAVRNPDVFDEPQRHDVASQIGIRDDP